MPEVPVFQVEHLTKIYAGSPPVRANQDICLTIGRGAIWGIFGPNGAGKTTLVRQMLGLLRPTSGRVLLYGQDVGVCPELIVSQVGYLPQGGHALYDFTPEEALYYTARLRGLDHAAAHAERARLIEQWQMGHYARRVIRRLSGGQQRLVGLASILVNSPPVLVLDEPTNFMDPGLRRLVWGHLLRLNREQQVTIVLVTHNVLEAETVVSQVAVVDRGRLLAHGTPADLKVGLGDHVHLDLAWHTLSPGAEQALAELGYPIHKLDALRWRITVAKSEADNIIQRLLIHTSLQDLVDLRLHSASLEDFYLAVTNGADDADEGVL